MAEYWQVLGIEPTGDERVIKRAYAKLLRIYRPEANAQEYQRLRNAYDQAIAFCKSEGNRVESSPVLPPDVAGQMIVNTEFSRKPIEKTQPADLVHAIMRDVDRLYHQYPARNQKNNWVCIFRNRIPDIDSQIALGDQIIFFLNTHPFVPQSVYRYFDSMFNWKQRGHDLENKYTLSFVDLLFEMIGDNARVLNYQECVGESLGFEDRETYFWWREMAYRVLTTEWEQAVEHIEAALAIHDSDPVLLKFAALHYRNHGEKARSLALYRRLYNLTNDNEAAYYAALLLYELGDIDEATALIHKTVLQVFDAAAECLYSKCTLASDELLAVRMYDRIQKRFPNDIEPPLFLYAIRNRKKYCFYFGNRGFSELTDAQCDYIASLIIPVDRKPPNKPLLKRKKQIGEWSAGVFKDRIHRKQDLIYYSEMMKDLGVADFERLRQKMYMMNAEERRAFVQSFPDRRQVRRAQIALAYLKRLPPAGIRAHTYSTAIEFYLDGISFGFIDKEEAIKPILAWTRLVQKSYSSWQDYLLAFFAGEAFIDFQASNATIYTRARGIAKVFFSASLPPWNTKI